MIKTLTAAAAFLVTVAGIADAQFLKKLAPVQAEAIELGATRGWAYYVAEPDGYHLDATLFAPGKQAPVHVTAIVNRGQSVSVTVPGGGGVAPRNVIFVRTGGRLVAAPAVLSR